MSKWIVMAFFVFLLCLMTGCQTTDTHVEGVASNVHGGGKSGIYFTVKGTEYHYSGVNIQDGDHLTFTYNDLWGVRDLKDATNHPYDYTIF